MTEMQKKSGGRGSRAVQIGEEIRQVMSELLLRGALRDPRLASAGMITVTEVRMSPDLRHAKVLVSVFPETPKAIADVFAALDSAEPELKRMVSHELRLRITPSMRFERDDSISQGAHIEALLRDIQAEDRAASAAAAEPEAPSPARDGGGDG
jgi:ribosome-binding factor A